MSADFIKTPSGPCMCLALFTPPPSTRPQPTSFHPKQSAFLIVLYSISSLSPAFIYCVSILCCIYSLCIHPLSLLSTVYPSTPVFIHCVRIHHLWSSFNVYPTSPVFIQCVSTFSGLYLLCIHPTPIFSSTLYPGLSGLHTL